MFVKPTKSRIMCGWTNTLINARMPVHVEGDLACVV
jgi:hypothetical protein